MKWQFFCFCSCLIALVIMPGGMAFSGPSIIRVDSEVKGPTEVYIRPANMGKYTRVKDEIPCDIPVEPIFVDDAVSIHKNNFIC